MDDNKKERVGVSHPHELGHASVTEKQAWEVRRERDAKEKECEALRFDNAKQLEIIRAYWKDMEELRDKNESLGFTNNTLRDISDKLQMERDHYQKRARDVEETVRLMAQTIDKLQNENARLAAKLRGIKMILKSANFRIDE